MSKNNGGPAFPTLHIPDCSPPAWNGMTLRDYFAANALNGVQVWDGLVNGKHSGLASLGAYKKIAKDAYLIADAMLKARGEE